MTLLKSVLFAAGVLGLGLWALSASGPAWHEAWCRSATPDRDQVPKKIKLLRCSNIDQTFDASGAVDAPSPEPGWDILAPQGEKAAIRVTLRKSADKALFYPRLSGADASIAVYETVGPFRRELFRLSGAPSGWTPMGAQFSVCLACVENGWSDEEFAVTLDIELVGKNTQLWHKGSTIFF